MTTFAIDPGPVESAYVIWDGERILEKGKVPSERVLPLIGMNAIDCRCSQNECGNTAVKILPPSRTMNALASSRARESANATNAQRSGISVIPTTERHRITRGAAAQKAAAI